MHYKTQNCPVCKKKYLGRSVTLHVINTAKHEARDGMFRLLNLAQGKEYTFSAHVVLREMPHVAYIRSHTKSKQYFRVDGDPHVTKGVKAK
jgi:hypothetical protein